MKLVKLVHNPTAGEEAHDQEKLETLINGHGFECRYSSTKKEGWEKLDDDIDFIATAGGDGTIRKAVQLLLNRKMLDKKFPLAILPMGTANNIAKSLGLDIEEEELVKAWRNDKRKKGDVGRLWGVADTEFFLESFGYGLFPQLMKEMKKKAPAEPGVDAELQLAMETFYELVQNHDACHCEIMIDGTDYSGRYLMVEVMNMRSVGPNLELAPKADPGDGKLEVVLVPENSRDKFAAHIKKLLAGNNSTFDYFTVSGQDISLLWQNGLCHADDKLIKLEKQSTVSITILHKVLEFLVP